MEDVVTYIQHKHILGCEIMVKTKYFNAAALKR